MTSSIHAGKRVLVTAGAAGIGRAIASAFSDAGANVHVCDVDPEAIARLGEDRPEITATRADVADEDAVRRVFQDFAGGYHAVDVLVNNAGIAGPTGVMETLDLADWRHCISVNIDSLFLFARQAIPAMKEARSGCIINLSSTAGLMGYPGRTPYCAAKWAVIGLTKSLAMELGPHNIRVNAICPGAVNGPRMDRVIGAQAQATGKTEDEIRTGYANASSMRTFVDAEDIAAAALFLASPAAARISGQAVPVDGHTEGLSG